jgi:hypothetical protein
MLRGGAALEGMGPDAEVCWPARQQNQGDALKHLSRMRAAHVPLRELPTKEIGGRRRLSAGADILVDGVLAPAPPAGPRARSRD